ncbi:hypothetical protein GCM10010247_67090 [Streptomyces calvus]|nr:hypothetical protein GCM10010247_67090 [Streptomyces calvus]
MGLATIPVRVDDARVSTDETLLEAAFVANYHSDDMTDLEEAHALQQLVEYYGSQTKAAKRLGIPQATISSKLPCSSSWLSSRISHRIRRRRNQYRWARCALRLSVGRRARCRARYPGGQIRGFTPRSQTKRRYLSWS